MLRKTINIFMSALFVLTTMGITVSKHYCGNKFVDFSINSQAESCCNTDGGCCHNESEHFQLREDFVNSVYVDNFQQFKINILFPVYFLVIDSTPIEELSSEIEMADLPPSRPIQTNLALLQTYLC